MTDRLKGCTVVFDRDIREDDAEPLISAIAQLRGVREVTPVLVQPDDWMNRERIRGEMREELHAALERFQKKEKP